METDDGNLDGTKASSVKGTWFEYNDGTSGTSQYPAVATGNPLLPVLLSSSVTHQPTGETSKYAMHTWGTVAVDSGNGYAGIGCNLNNGTAAFNASSYKGVLFYAQLGSTGAATSVRLEVPLSTTTATTNGGTCTGSKCGVHWNENITGLTSTWQAVTVQWSDPTFLLPSYGNGASWDATQVFGLNFQAAAGTTFDFWIDDIYFIK
jgi:hypothetical protein